ncbi:MAG: rod shape-determining protein MreC [Patescibacteria group bacterium]
MKIHFPLKNRRQNRWGAFLPATYLFLVIFGVYIFTPGLPSSISFFFVRPIVAVGYFVSSSLSFVGRILLPGALEREHTLLEKQAAQVRELKFENEAVRSENSALRGLLSIEKNSETVRAGILTRPPRTPFDVFTLDAGLSDGVRAGSRVLYAHSALLGDVVEIGKAVSKVELLSSPGKITDAIVESRGSAIELTGRGGGNFIAVLPQDFDIEVDDVIVTPGKQGYVVARVAAVVSNPTDSLKRVLLTSPVNIQEVRFVDIVLPLE